MLYSVVVVALIVLGLLAAGSFLVTHRPSRWLRLEAIDASGWVLLIVIFLARALILSVLRWPTPAPSDPGDTAVSVGLLVLVDVLLIVRVAAYRRFVRRDRHR